MTQPEVIYANVFTNLLKMPLNVGLQANCSRDIGNLGR